MKEPPYFDGISLDTTINLRWIQTLEDYFEAKGYSTEEIFIIATRKHQGYGQYWFKCLRRERALQDNSRIKT